MLKSFKKLVDQLTDTTADNADADSQLAEAAAVLLVVAATMDGEFDQRERDAALKSLSQHFDISAFEAQNLLRKGEQKAGSAVEYSRYTIAIRSRYTQEQRIEIIEMLWEVVLADGVLHAYEANLLRRMGGLIHVSDRENGEARKRVEERQRGNFVG